MKALAAFIRARRGHILHDWTEAAACLPSAGRYPIATIRDHIPELLDAMADILEAASDDVPTFASVDQAAQVHARERVQEAYDVKEMVDEYRLLRSILMNQYLAQGGVAPGVQPRLRALGLANQVIDRAIREAVERYVEERDRLGEVMAGVLGHDLRTPLQAIEVSVDLLRQSAPEHHERHAARIERSARRMRRMIDDLLDFTRARLAGGIPIAPRETDLRALTHAVVAEVAAAHPDRQIHSLAETAEGDFSGQWDPDRLEQVIVNLLDNALVHGGDPIEVAPVDEGGGVTIEVRNQGEMPAELLKSAFEPFTAPRSPDKQGLGLGLFIISAIARAHGGEVSVESSAAAGTVFTVRLPRLRGRY